MIVFPGIFLKDGRCGDNSSPVSPVKLAKSYEEMGAAYLHIIDMDGSVAGHPGNKEVLREIMEEVSIPVQAGGGIRSLTDIERLLNLGAARVVTGTKAVGNPAFVKDIITNFGKEKIVVSIDAKDGIIVTDGWGKTSTQRAVTHAMQMKQLGVKYISYVDASKKSHSSFAFIEEIQELYKRTGLYIIAMGNMCSLKELEKLEEIKAFGVVLSPSYMKGEFSIKNAIEIFNKGDGYGV